MSAIFLILATMVSVADVPNPRISSGGWVTDLSALFSPEEERRLNSKIDALERELGFEIAIVAVDQVDTSPKEFATALFNRWKIGKTQEDNGLLILIVKDARRMEMETGYGMEAYLPDGWLGSMQVSAMVPLFKEGRFASGVEVGLEIIDKRLRDAFDPNAPRPKNTFYQEKSKFSAGSGQAWLLGGLGVFLLGFGLFARWVFQRFRKRCPTCKMQMLLLSEEVEDEHLSRKQEFEESIGSVNYDVYCCQTCDHIKVLSRGRWFSGYSRCRKCQTKALKSSSATLVSATYTHGGQVQVTEYCSYCKHSYSYTRSTPRLTSPSSSSSGSSYSSSSGSSFGGGSSGGGGAGSSW